jgi:hypothetical protein
MEIEDLINSFPSFSKSVVLRLQTTYFELGCKESTAKVSKTFRIHYEHKHEFNLRAGEIKSLTFEIEHPLLLQYHQPICRLQLVSEVTDKTCFLNQLNAATYEVFNGWRQADDYCFMPPEKFIEKRFGILMEAPKPYIDAVTKKAEACGVKLVSGKAGKPRALLAKALILGDMYVIADGFRVEKLN